MALKADALIGQFVLCRSDGCAPEQWPRRRQGSWVLASHPALPVVEILARDSAPIEASKPRRTGLEPLGWLLGYPISPDGRLVTEAVHFPLSPTDSDAAAEFESALYAYGGRFAAVLLTPAASRFYLDPCGSLAAVFCREQQLVASTTSLVPRRGDPESNDDLELIRALGIPHKNTWFPFGLTPRRSVERLLPNHFLDLETWETFRHWPTAEIAANGNLRESAAEIASILKGQISAVALEYPLHMSLTAGRDSRILLACAREHLDDIVFFTYRLPDNLRRTDCDVARRMARRLALNHIILPFEQASEAELDEWIFRTGGCIGGLDAQLDRTYQKLDPARAYLSGQAGDVVRAPFWDHGDTESTALSSEDLLKRMAWSLPIRSTPEIRDRSRRWLQSVPTMNTLAMLDLLYIEQRLGCWAGPRDYGYVHSAFILYPFCNRRIFEVMLSVPPRDKREKKLESELIRGQWPELLRFPFNAPLGVKGLFHTAKDAIGRRRARLSRRRRAPQQ